MGIVEFLISMLVFLSDKLDPTTAVLLVGMIFLFFSQRGMRKFLEANEQRRRSTVPSVSAHMTDIVRSSATVNRQLDKMVESLGADRGWVYLFHNSGYDFLGQPFAKVTNTNESLKPGTPSKISSMKDIPVGIMACYVESLLTDYEIRCPDIEKYKEYDQTAYVYLKESGIKSTYAVAIFAPKPEHTKPDGSGRSSIGSIPLGFIGIDYLTKYRELSEEEFKSVHDCAMVIKGLLIERRRNEVEEGACKPDNFGGDDDQPNPMEGRNV
jgi:hypothetical protein